MVGIPEFFEVGVWRKLDLRSRSYEGISSYEACGVEIDE